MCKKVCFLPLFVSLMLVGSAYAYTTGTVLKCDAEGTGDDYVTQTGWTRVIAGWNLDVNDVTDTNTGIDVKLETGDPAQISARREDEDYHDDQSISGTVRGPLMEVEADFWFSNNRNKSPENDFILTLSNLLDGAYRMFSYHNRTNEAPVPIPKVTVSGASSVLSTPSDLLQDHVVMDIPAETLFSSSGGGNIVIRFKGPDFGGGVAGESGQAYFNGFILEYFGADNEAPYDPVPAHEAENLCPGDVSELSWTVGTSATSHTVYFGTSISEVNEAGTPDATVFTNSWTPPAPEMGKTYYWRVDEVTGGPTWKGAIWQFTTNDGNAFDPFPGDEWRGVSTDTDVSWEAGCSATSHEVYFSDVNTLVIDRDPSVKATPPGTSYDPGTLSAYTWYYWRVVEKSATETWVGPVWSFKTGSGVAGVVMYYKFDGTAGTQIPSTLPDSTGNVTFTRYLDGAGSLTYGDSNPVVNADTGASASFDPNAGLYRDDTGASDPLRLDGYQYTIEAWVRPDSLPDTGDASGFRDSDDKGAMVVNKYDDWALELHLFGGVVFFHTGIEPDRQNKFIYSGKNTIRAGEWQHIAAVFDLTDPEANQRLYVDGRLMATSASPFQNPPDDANAVGIGLERLDDGTCENYFDGLIDELRIQNVALEPEDFLLVPGPEWARGPNPPDKATRVDPNAVLTWVPGSSAGSHDVYFGTSHDDVKAGTGGTFRGNQILDANEYDPPGALDYGTTYYWRIDEVNGVHPNSPWKGLVWRFRTQGYVDDPNLLLWYPFDETSGNEAFDASGHDYIGLIDEAPDEGPAWDANDGQFAGGSLEFDDDTGIDVGEELLGNIYDEITIAVWLKNAYRDGEDNWVFDSGWGPGFRVRAAVVEEDNERVLWRAGNDSNDRILWDLGGSDPERLEGWHLWAFLKDEDADRLSIYMDGEEVATKDGTTGTLRYVLYAPFRIGATTGSSDDFEGKMDDFRVYDFALSTRQVEALYRGGDLARAWQPKPRDGATNVVYTTDLTWQAGDYADYHRVFFGTNFDDVNDATTASAGIYKGTRNLGNELYDPGELLLDKEYYWRIDEVNDSNLDSPWIGKTWRFRIANFLVVEDMEAYDDDAIIPTNPINATWIDGWINYTGSTVYLEYGSDATVRGGGKAMWIEYENDWPNPAVEKYSEVYANTATGETNLGFIKDWTKGGVEALVLYFYGDPNNDVEPMYVMLEDTTGANSISNYGILADQDLNDIADDDWQAWNMDLSEFSGNGVAIDDINKIYIGLGDRDNPVAGGSGNLYIDDIRLYLPRCVPRLAQPPFDFSDNCIVDYADIRMMAEQWLVSDINAAPVTPPGSPVLHYSFDGDVSGSTITDVVGGYNGTFFTEPNQVPAEISGRIDPGKSGNSFHFSTDIDTGGIMIPTTMWTENSFSQDITVAMFIKNAYPDEEPEGTGYMWEFREWNGVSEDANDRVLAVQVKDNGDNYVWRDQDESVTYEHEWDYHTGWQHCAFVRTDSNLAIYVNGLLEEISDSNGTAMATPQLLYLGVSADRTPAETKDDLHDGFTGNVDDFMIFNYALSREEIAHIASDGYGLVLMDSPLNVWDEESDGDRAINFKDYAKVMDTWLDEILWP